MKRRTLTCKRKGSAVLLAAALAVGLYPPDSRAEEGKFLISQRHFASGALVITNSGSYVFVEDIVVGTGSNGVQVKTDNVSIDLNGHTLRGASRSGSGVYQDTNYVSLTVRNGIIRDWYLDDGIRAMGRNNRIENVRAVNNRNGIQVGPGGLVVGCVAWSNQYVGILLSNATAIGCAAYENGDGIQVDGGLVEDCAVTYNAGSGIEGWRGSVVGCVAYGNGSRGIYVYSGSGSGSGVKESSAMDNAGDGINCFQDCSVERCYARGNGAYGVYLGNRASVSETVSRGNGQSGIRCQNQAMVENCVVYGNGGSGIRLFLGQCRAAGNTVCANGNSAEGIGIYSLSARNRIEDNLVTASSNGVWIYSPSAEGNVIVKNAAMYNLNGNYTLTTSNNIVGPILKSTFTTSSWANFESGL